MKMQKKTMVILGGVVVAAAVLILAASFLRNRGGDINGVTSYPDKNTIIMNAYRDGSPYTSGSGFIEVAEGEHIHVEYDLQEGSFDVVFTAKTDPVQSAVMEAENDLPNLPEPEEWQDYAARMAADDGSVGQDGIQGQGSLDLAAQPGTCTGYFYPHDMEGKVTVTVQKD